MFRTIGEISTRRERVSARFRDASAYPITIVVAPAGFGKSTAIHNFLADHGDASVIRTPDASSLERFIGEFARVLAFRVPEIVSVPEWTRAGSDMDEAVEVYVAWALNHLSNAGGTIAIDDLHHGSSDPGVLAFVTRIVDGTKKSLKWILSSRTSDGLPIARWQAYAESDAPITADDLRLTTGEALAFASIIGSRVAAAQIELWQKQTDGFAVPLAYAIRRSARVDSTDDITKGTRSLTFSFLAEQLWNSLSEDDRSLLETASFLSSIHTYHLESAGIEGASRRAATLCQDIAFLSISNDGIFMMHDLFKDFVQNQIYKEGPNALLKRQSLAIDALLAAKRLEEAILLAISSNSIRLKEIIDQSWRTLKEPALVKSIVEHFAELDASRMSLGTLALNIEYWSSIGDSRRAERFGRELLRRKDADSNLVLLGITSIQRLIDFGSTLEPDLLVNEISENFDRLNPTDRILLHANEASFLARSERKQAEAKQLVESISKTLSSMPSREKMVAATGICAASYWLGNHADALEYARTAVDAASALGDVREYAKALNNFGLMQIHTLDPAASSTFEVQRAVVERSGAWRFSHVSHWLPAWFYALQADSVATRRALAVQQLAHATASSQRDRFHAFHRFCTYLASLTDEDYGFIVRDFETAKAATLTIDEYGLTVCVALAYKFLGDADRSADCLSNARKLYVPFTKIERHAVRESLVLEIICLGLNGRWLQARKLLPVFAEDFAQPVPFKKLIKCFCDGSPFTGIRSDLASCLGKPFMGLHAAIIERIVDNQHRAVTTAVLTAAEQDVLKLISLGKTNKAIATARNRSAETVKRQIASIYKKLGAENRTSALSLARESGLI
jgi:DNA-binding CsgD family transcriptional regulator/tetratricopeptide (TPR) repeat protein